MKGNNFFHHNIVGRALAPEAINNETIDGDIIVEPWTKGRQLSFIAIGGAFAATTDGTFGVKGRLRGTNTWEKVKDKNNADLEVTGAKVDDGGELEAGRLLGTIALEDFDGVKYDAVRCFFTNGAAVDAFMGVAYVISDLYQAPPVAAQTEEFWARMHP